MNLWISQICCVFRLKIALFSLMWIRSLSGKLVASDWKCVRTPAEKRCQPPKSFLREVESIDAHFGSLLETPTSLAHVLKMLSVE
jgi:hypothetical protein